MRELEYYIYADCPLAFEERVLLVKKWPSRREPFRSEILRLLQQFIDIIVESAVDLHLV